MEQPGPARSHYSGALISLGFQQVSARPYPLHP
jgi:hypothetical protein